MVLKPFLILKSLGNRSAMAFFKLMFMTFLLTKSLMRVHLAIYSLLSSLETYEYHGRLVVFNDVRNDGGVESSNIAYVF